jgi:hypothetical protein
LLAARATLRAPPILESREASMSFPQPDPEKKPVRTEPVDDTQYDSALKPLLWLLLPLVAVLVYGFLN